MVRSKKASGDAAISKIKNKDIRKGEYQKQKTDKLVAKKRARKERKKLEETLPEDQRPEKKQPRTIESIRRPNDTIVDPSDKEVLADEEADKLQTYFEGKPPKIMISTSNRAVGRETTYQLVRELEEILPNAFFYERKGYKIKDIVKYASNAEFTELLVVNEDHKEPNALIHCHLPDGPTAYYKLTSFVPHAKIWNKARTSEHYPELVLNNFGTRLGHTIGRMFASLIPQKPDFMGRRVITFHNQRDYIFFRHHRYIFKEGKRVGLQEIGPQFTLKLKWLQKGTFDPKHGEYEYIHKRNQLEKADKRTFYL
eukprot:Clim_evm24s201 gene=Clim_evmTU24s201